MLEPNLHDVHKPDALRRNGRDNDGQQRRSPNKAMVLSGPAARRDRIGSSPESDSSFFYAQFRSTILDANLRCRVGCLCGRSRHMGLYCAKRVSTSSTDIPDYCKRRRFSSLRDHERMVDSRCPHAIHHPFSASNFTARVVLNDGAGR